MIYVYYDLINAALLSIRDSLKKSYLFQTFKQLCVCQLFDTF